MTIFSENTNCDRKVKNSSIYSTEIGVGANRKKTQKEGTDSNKIIKEGDDE